MEITESSLFISGSLSDEQYRLQSRVNMVFEDLEFLRKQEVSQEITGNIRDIRDAFVTLVEAIRLEDDSDSIRRIAGPVKRLVEDLKKDTGLSFHVLQRLEIVRGTVEALLNYRDIF